MLYEIIIRPIEYLIETVFFIMYDFWGREGLAILSVSIIVNLLVLPLYLRADAIQEAEQKKQQAMSFWIKHIRKTFSGDERLLMQSAYYKESGYHPLSVLKGTFSLLLQIPFFMAAYHYLSNLQVLRGASFGPIADLGSPDAMIALGALHLNLLPILMTLINCISGAVYTKGLPLRKSMQIYILALVFLFLLYDSPSGLVLYWTMNNLFSLCKNFVQKNTKAPKKILAAFFTILSLIYASYLFMGGRFAKVCAGKDYEEMLWHFCILVLLNTPLAAVLGLFRRFSGKTSAKGQPKSCIYILEVALALFLGAFIPLSVISASPTDFVDLYQYISPLHYVVTSLCVSTGLVLLWGNVICSVASEKGKRIFGLVLFFLLAAGLIDFMFFHPEIGMVSRELVFDWLPKYSRPLRVVNLLLLMGLLPLCALLWNKGYRIVQYIASVLLFTILGVSLWNLKITKDKLSAVDFEQARSGADTALHLSRTEKNVVVIMLDRSVGAYVPFIMEEFPELAKGLDGFTLYPNTVSTGLCTNYGSPALYGGYDYTTSGMNARDDLPLEQKHNEALLVMPRLFSEAGYRVSTWDPPYANYSIPSDLSLFDAYPEIHAVHMEGRFGVPYGQDEYERRVERSFFFYSLYKIAPAVMQDEIYDGGHYMCVDNLAGDQAFLEAYEILHHLGDLTSVDEGSGAFTMICNSTPHDPILLQMPGYTVQAHTDNSAFPDYAKDRHANGRTLHFSPDNIRQCLGHYHSNVRSLLEIAAWCDQLRSLGVYDNTRIIIASDHGTTTQMRGLEEALMLDDIDILAANALLMVKDYDAHGFTCDPAFMTNADVPALALDRIVADPVNPFTQNAIGFAEKENGADIIWAVSGDIFRNNGNTFGPEDASWYHVNNGDIFNEENWSRLR